jgi:hypothetical protein
VESPTRTDVPAELRAVRLRRSELRETLGALEAALASPASGREQAWSEHVHSALTLLAGDFATHVDVTEGPGGLHQSILAGDLRLANAVDALTREHAVIAAEITELTQISGAAATPAAVGLVREQGTRLLGHVVRHRQRGADLVYEAFAVDLGGGD